MMNKICLVLFLGCLSYQNGRAQKGLITPLHEFMQANSDSTIVLEYTGNWLVAPNLLLLSRKSDTINAYTYRDLSFPSAYQKPMPSKIGRELLKKGIWTVPVSVNAYFKPKDLDPKIVTRFWAEVASLNPWLLTDDATQGQGCPPVKSKDGIVRDTNIYDGGGIRLYLITSSAIKILDYNAPGYYEESCPGRADRIALLKIEKLFKSYID
jgi:hypothetical protein